jgi:hypothetical protein
VGLFKKERILIILSEKVGDIGLDKMSSMSELAAK